MYIAQRIYKSNQVQGENGNQVTKSDEESNQVKGEKELSHPKLTKQQEDIRNFCSIPRTAQEIMDRLGITNQSKNRRRYNTIPMILQCQA